MRLKTLRIEIVPTFDRQFIVNGHLCRKDRVAALLTVSHAAAEQGELPVYTQFSPDEFYQIVSKVYPDTTKHRNLISGVLPGVKWKVRIRKLREV
jgi:hypothetical protein